jgi:multisubunit Na+/H+ antiporter MnhG subunit
MSKLGMHIQAATPHRRKRYTTLRSFMVLLGIIACLAAAFAFAVLLFAIFITLTTEV